MQLGQLFLSKGHTVTKRLDSKFLVDHHLLRTKGWRLRERMARNAVIAVRCQNQDNKGSENTNRFKLTHLHCLCLSPKVW
jgi:hypothetical protein